MKDQTATRNLQTKNKATRMAAMMVEKPKSEHFDLAPMFEQTNCLNEDSNNAHGNIFNEGVESYLESDADEQILLRINFKSAVKIAELQLGCPEGETVPTSVKLFINTPDLGFDEVRLKLFSLRRCKQQQMFLSSVSSIFPFLVLLFFSSSSSPSHLLISRHYFSFVPMLCNTPGGRFDTNSAH